jgi:hypothetical protein
MPSLLLCCVGRRPKSFSKQNEQLENGRTERRRRHTAVTIKCGSGELTGDGSRRFPEVRTGRESLRDSQIQPLSDWGQAVAGSNPVSPTKESAGGRRFRSNPEPFSYPPGVSMAVRIENEAPGSATFRPIAHVAAEMGISSASASKWVTFGTAAVAARSWSMAGIGVARNARPVTGHPPYSKLTYLQGGTGIPSVWGAGALG